MKLLEKKLLLLAICLSFVAISGVSWGQDDEDHYHHRHHKYKICINNHSGSPVFVEYQNNNGTDSIQHASWSVQPGSHFLTYNNGDFYENGDGFIRIGQDGDMHEIERIAERVPAFGETMWNIEVGHSGHLRRPDRDRD